MSWSGQVIEVPQIPIYGEDNETITGFEPGYRLNCDPATRDAALAADPAFASYIVTPSNPFCIFAGAQEDTVFLVFEDLDEAQASAIGAWWSDPE